MNVSALLSYVPNGIAIVAMAVVLVMGALIFYALSVKGDVRAEFSHGSTMFKLEAKDRGQDTKKVLPH